METKSEQIMQGLQAKLGSADFKNLQAIRKRFYSYVVYPQAGASVLTFFGSALGQNNVTREYTNMPQAGQFGKQHFQLKTISCHFKIQTWDTESWAGTHATTLFSDLIGGFAQAGVLNFKINARPYIQLPKPFLYAPPFDGRSKTLSAGLDALTLTEGTPNTILTYRSGAPYGTTNCAHEYRYRVDPNVLIESGQQFECTIGYPSGLIPVLASSVVTSDVLGNAAALHVGVILDGIVYRPVQ